MSYGKAGSGAPTKPAAATNNYYYYGYQPGEGAAGNEPHDMTQHASQQPQDLSHAIGGAVGGAVTSGIGHALGMPQQPHAQNNMFGNLPPQMQGLARSMMGMGGGAPTAAGNMSGGGFGGGFDQTQFDSNAFNVPTPDYGGAFDTGAFNDIGSIAPDMSGFDPGAFDTSGFDDIAEWF